LVNVLLSLLHIIHGVNHCLNRETNRQEEIKRLVSAGKIPYAFSVTDEAPKSITATYPLLMGSVAALVKDVLPAKVIVEQMVKEAVERLEATSRMVNVSSKL
jgi:hypothetical protein